MVEKYCVLKDLNDQIQGLQPKKKEAVSFSNRVSLIRSSYLKPSKKLDFGINSTPKESLIKGYNLSNIYGNTSQPLSPSNTSFD